MVPEDERILIGDARTVTQGSAPLSNLGAALALLGGLHRHGLRHVVLCPGSRSGPLAVAAGALRAEGVRLHTAIDERSAAFFALGLARVEGWPAAVVTTSGTAVANLLPAAVEADHGSLPLLLLTADRPARLKGCGANQSVNQERFLIASCRWQGLGDPRGLAFQTRSELERLAEHAMERAMGQELGEAGRMPPGPVHLNLPFEDPLHARPAELLDLGGERAAPAAAGGPGPRLPPGEAASTGGAPSTGEVLDPDRPGVVVAGPWRGLPHTWRAHLEALRRWQQRSGWPVLADPLSGLRGEAGLELVAGYDLLLARGPGDGGGPAEAQVLRLGPLPASRRLQDWLSGLDGRQVLVSEADPRPLDPLGRISGQFSGGLEAWVRALASPGSWSAPDAAAVQLAHRWLEAEARVQRWLDGKEAQAAGDRFEEPWLARQLSRLLPAGLPLMLANSSPVRDWETFAACGPARPVLGFRGASGIDGTLSIACGAAEAHGALVLVCGDLALLHDSNGWLWHQRLGGRLTVILIDNGGGGIFEQLPIRADPGELLDFETLFAMPQTVDPLALAAAHGVPGRAIGRPGELPRALSWALEQPMALLRVQTDRHADAALRRRLRTMAAREICPP